MLIRILNSKPFIIVMLVANLIMLALLLYLRFDQHQEEEVEPLTVVDKEEVSVLRLTFLGDILSRKEQLLAAKRGNDTYDFHPTFEFVTPYIARADMAFANLETVFAGRQAGRTYDNDKRYNAPDTLALAIKDAGIDFLFTANDHACDQGAYGLARTINILDKYGIGHTGTFTNRPDANEISLITVKGIKLAVLAYTESANGEPPLANTFRLNRMTKLAIRNDIQAAYKKKADVIIVSLHFGDPYQREPNERQKEIAQYCKSLGAHIIIGTNPHVLQPVECFTPAKGNVDQGVLAYSLGNFLSHEYNNYASYANAGLMLSVELYRKPESSAIIIDQVQVVPTFVTILDTDTRKQHTIFPAQLAVDSRINIADSLLSKEQAQQMKEAYLETQSWIIGERMSSKDCIVLDTGV